MLCAFLSAILSLACLSIRAQGIHGFKADGRFATYLSQLVKEFKENPTHPRFDSVILPPRVTGDNLEDFMCPKVFIWCPVTHYGLKINCPLHGCLLKPSFFTDQLSKISARNPRLVYDLRGNVLLVQRMYVCNHSGVSHRYLSASETVFQSIPRLYSDYCFPFVMFYKSACTKELLDLIETQILQGVSFLKMSEGLAALNFKEFSTRLQCFSLSSSSSVLGTNLYDRFYSDMLYSFPCNANLIRIFLANFQTKQAYYEADMKKRASHSKTISCDHTFKVSKYIGARRGGDNKFVKQFQNLFIVLNDKREIISWQLTTTTAFEEIKSLLEQLRDTQISTVVVDDCCKVRAQYQSVFPGIQVKLDLFHAVQRVTKSIPKGTEFSKQFSKEFGTIFRNNGDCDTVRKLPTPAPEEIETNLNNLIKRWNRFLKLDELKGTLSEIERLRGHIKKGCLSGLLPGEGTEPNENLHRTLNKTLLCGATTIGPELVLAILSLLFYGINCKIDGKKHIGNSQIIPFIPLFASQGSDDAHVIKPVAFNQKSTEQIPLDNVWQFHNEKYDDITTDAPSIQNTVVVVEHMQDMCNDTISELLLNNTEKLHHVLKNINTDCKDKCFNAYDLPIMQLSSVRQVLIAEDGTNNMEQSHILCLRRNLASFNRCVDPVVGDGDCAFRSIVVQLRKTEEWKEQNTTLMEHLIGLGLGKGLDEDVFQLRQCFVDTVQSNEHYLMFSGIALDDINDETERFRDQGSFCGEIGDLVIKVCSDILKVPIFVITSMSGCCYLPFFPDEPIIGATIYIAYTACGPGHYDGTMLIPGSNTESSGHKVTNNGCSCGKNSKRKEQASCLHSESRCPCVETGELCTRNCRCKSCNNGKDQEKGVLHRQQIKDISCTCGLNKLKSDIMFTACKDGERKSKCPCLRAGQECSSLCRCVHCGNGNDSTIKTTRADSRSKLKRKRNNPSPYKKRRSSEYLKTMNKQPLSGPWTTYETCLLYCTISMISATVVPLSAENIRLLYNCAAEKGKKGGYLIRTKTLSQVSGKLRCLEEKQNIASVLIN